MTPPRLILPALLVLVAAAGCTSGSGGAGATTGTVTASGPATAQTASLQMRDTLTFSPNVVKAVPGSLTLAIENVGGVPHNLTFDDASLGHTDTVSGHGTATLTVRLPKAGTYTFVCTFHSGMTGKVVVTG